MKLILCTKLLLINTIAVSIAVLSVPKNAFAGFRIVEEVREITNTQTEITIIPGFAEAVAVINGPGGGQDGPYTSTTNPVRAYFEVPDSDGTAVGVASARANPISGTAGFGWIVKAGRGYDGNGTNASARKRIISEQVTQVTVLEVIVTLERFKQEIDGYLSGNNPPNLNYGITLNELNSNTSLLNSTTTFTSNSPDLIQDSSGLLSWSRVPGEFGGVGETTNLDFPTPFSNNRWELATQNLSFTIPVTLNPGQNLDLDLSLASFATADILPESDGIVGASDKPIPEPSSTFSLLVLTTLGAASTLKRKLNQKSTEKETVKVS